MSKASSAGRCGLIGAAAVLLSLAAVPVHAQGFPPGSYLRTCSNVQTYGDRLMADCRRMDGSWGTTALRDVDRCVGDIGNLDGQLTCNRTDRSYGWSLDRNYGQGPGYGYDHDFDTGPGYGSSSGSWRYRGDWPPAGYPSGYGR